MTTDEAIEILQDDAYMLYEDDSPYNRQAYDMAIEALENEDRLAEDLQNILELYRKKKAEGEALKQPQIIRCKDCNKASKCYGDVLMKSRGGGYIYCPLEFCSEAERRTE